MTFILALTLCGLAAALREQPVRTHTEVEHCSCGQPVYSGLCWDKPPAPTPCCLLWATECPATSPIVKSELGKTCNFHNLHFIHAASVLQKCQQVECLSVYNALQSTRDLQRQQKPFNFDLVRGGSNKGKWFTKCACGKFNEATQQCQVKGKSKEKPCCSDLNDCSESDDWPVLVKKKADAANFLQSQNNALTALSKECHANCLLRYEELCFEDLKEVVTEEGMTRQAVFVAKTQQLGQLPDAYDKAYLTHTDSVDKMKKKEGMEREERIYEKSRKQQVDLVDLSTWDRNFGSESPPLSASCCKCQKTLSKIGAARVTSFCTSSTCPDDCQIAFPGFCSKSPKNCLSPEAAWCSQQICTGVKNVLLQVQRRVQWHYQDVVQQCSCCYCNLQVLKPGSLHVLQGEGMPKAFFLVAAENQVHSRGKIQTH